MKYLTIEYIKQHLRLDFDCEDSLLELYGDSAEETIEMICNRTLDDIQKQYGRVPANIYHAALMLVAQSYQHREPVSTQNLSVVPYGFDILIKPYMALTTKTDCNG